MPKFFAFIVALVLTGLTNSVHSSTVVLVAPEDINSTAIGAIFQGILSRDDQSTLIASNNVNETIEQRIARADSIIIILGHSLIEQIDPREGSSNIIGGAFYGIGNNPAGIKTLSLDPSLETVVSEIRKTGLKLEALRTVVAAPNTIVSSSSYTQNADELSVLVSPKIATGEREYARAWFDLLQNIDPTSEAILVNDVEYLDSSGAYRYITETAWRRNILVVSTLPQYSRRGVSIGFIPDLQRYGQKLCDLAKNPSEHPDQELWTDFPSLNRVFNHRTLVHIGLNLPDDIDRLNGIDLVIE